MAETDPKTEAGGGNVWLRAARAWGVGAAIGGYIVWWLTTSFAAQQQKIIDKLDEHDTRMQLVQKHLEDDSERAWIMVGILQELCLQGAKGDAQAQRRCVALKGPAGR